ncbi:ubiquitin carboxyl-terminal hydrolase-domain-containing protein [Desarmillaria tabescens]|uniref:Ubiquitin carboxyl-terminal hydrolase-domain-containing protein n=1 Tax=Armillaria tabescens TaxID=1929756 RepID=A0AA39KC87_ARMTA|nr:ubiquitin carboxyl-terminal hydrolase-domain-containing protein [Desarmillaria tabescens]KAK0458455.1 ubiquitin carboxyl-terminal hydrolase-domain-containing protein [Desarmillaria tabescens]
MASYRPITPISTTFPQPVTALSFDPVSDILWAGSQSGIVTAYVSEGMSGVSFRVSDLPVLKVVAGESYVRAAGSRGLGFGTWGKGGVNKWHYRSSTPVLTFSTSTNSSNVIGVSVVGPELLLINPPTGTVVRQTQTPSLITHLEFSHSSLISGAVDGFVRTHDPRTGIARSGGSEHMVRAHPSGIQGLQTSGNFIFTIGLQTRQGRPFPDQLVKVYDLRTMRALPPFPFPAWTRIDTTSYLTSVALSPTGAYMAFGDADGLIHLSTQVDEGGLVPFNGFEGQPVEWANVPAPLPNIEWSDSIPLNSIGMPHYSSPLLSSWSPQFMTSNLHYPPPPKIPLQILNSVKTNDNIAYAALPKELRGRRNVISVAPRKQSARFRSGKSHSVDEPDTPLFGTSGDEIPSMYRHVEIEYSKFGVEDFDFGFYNKTEYSGLETHILNSYTNPMLQAMHYIRPIRRLAKSHISTDCNREHCLLCELGFVVRMLEDARGTNCQSSNFCKTVGVLAQTSNAIDLIDYGRESNEVDHGHMIQSFHRFLVDHLSSEGNAFPRNPVLVKRPSYIPDPYNPAAAPITQLMGIDARNVITCMNCKAVRTKENVTHIVDLVYPRKVASNEVQPANDFTNILRDSLLRQMTHKATCQTCKQFSTFSSRRSIASADLPAILAVNACVNSEDNLKTWMDRRNQTFLPSRVELQGQVEGVDDPEKIVYELRAIIVQVITEDEHSHLVALVKVPEAEQGLDSPWYLFNDFVVRNVSEEEALSFPNKWKVPAVLHFEREDMRDAIDFSELPFTSDDSILSRDTSISINRDSNLIKHECLRYEELPRPGTLVAIDAEFVSMQQEETEYRSDGTKKVIRPARLSLARVSQGVPFIDDHIHTSEVIVDYLTEFSGIRFGDLDLLRSPYTLTPLKVVYKKLRLLVDRGCIFIGHGLSKDFRIINIFVPPDQVIDTVDLYFLKSRQRRLSLRFLSWFDTHDSIEDARSALNLYKAYHQFEEQGIFDQKLEELYKEGRQCNFKPPPANLLLEAQLAQMYPTGHTPSAARMPTPGAFMQHPNVLRHRGDEHRYKHPNYHRSSR